MKLSDLFTNMGFGHTYQSTAMPSLTSSSIQLGREMYCTHCGSKMKPVQEENPNYRTYSPGYRDKGSRCTCKGASEEMVTRIAYSHLGLEPPSYRPSEAAQECLMGQGTSLLLNSLSRASDLPTIQYVDGDARSHLFKRELRDVYNKNLRVMWNKAIEKVILKETTRLREGLLNKRGAFYF